MLDQLTIVAPGLLGGSVARAARARGLARRIVIWARRPEQREALRAQPWCDAAPDALGEAVASASLVVLAAPVTRIVSLATQIAPFLAEGALVTDVGSTKAEIARLCHAAMPRHARFVASHPMAGSDKTGWENGSAELFEGRSCLVTPLAETESGALDEVQRFWEALGMHVTRMNPDLHDEVVAQVSHLPQMVSSTLAAHLASTGKDWRAYAGNGLRDTLRIAGSDPEMWMDILDRNRDEILAALRAYGRELQRFTDSLEERDWKELRSVLERGRDYRRGLDPRA